MRVTERTSVCKTSHSSSTESIAALSTAVYGLAGARSLTHCVTGLLPPAGWGSPSSKKSHKEFHLYIPPYCK